MDYVMKLVTTALEWSYAAGEMDVRAETLQAAAELLTLRRDAIRLIDGAGPTGEQRPPEAASQGSAGEPSQGRTAADPPPERGRRKKTVEPAVENAETERRTS